MLSIPMIHAFFQQFGLETIEENALLFMRLQYSLIYLAYLQTCQHSSTASVSFDPRRTTSLSCFAAIVSCYTDSISKLLNEFANFSKNTSKSKKLLRPSAGGCKPEVDFPSHPSFVLPGTACLTESHAYDRGHQELGYPVKKRQETKSDFRPDLEAFMRSYQENTVPLELSPPGQQAHRCNITFTESLPFTFSKVHNTMFNASSYSELLSGVTGQLSERSSRDVTGMASPHGTCVSRATNPMGDSSISSTSRPSGQNTGAASGTRSSPIDITGDSRSPTGTPVPQTSTYVQGQAPFGNQAYLHRPASSGSASDASEGSSYSPDNPTFAAHISLNEIENVCQSEVGYSQITEISSDSDDSDSSMFSSPQITFTTSRCMHVSSIGESTLYLSTLLNHENSGGDVLSESPSLAPSPSQNSIDAGRPHSTPGSQGSVSRASTESSAVDTSRVAPYTTQSFSNLSSPLGRVSSADFTSSSDRTPSIEPYESGIGSSSLLPLTSQQMSLNEDISVSPEPDAIPTLSHGTSSAISSLGTGTSPDARARYTGTFDKPQACAITFIIDQNQCEAFSQGDPAVTQLLRVQAAAKVKAAREQVQNQAQDDLQKNKQQEQHPPFVQPGTPQEISYMTSDIANCFAAPATPGVIDIQRHESLHKSPGSTNAVPKALDISAARLLAQNENQPQITAKPGAHLDQTELEVRVLPGENGYAPHGKVTVFRVNPVTSEETTRTQSAQKNRQEERSQNRVQEAQVTEAQIQQLQARQIQSAELQGATRDQAQNFPIQSNALVSNPQTEQSRYFQNLDTQQWSPVAPSSQWTGSNDQNHIMSQSMAPQWAESKTQSPMMSQWAGIQAQNLVMPQSMPPSPMPPQPMPPQPMPSQTMPPHSIPLPSMTPQYIVPQPMPPHSMPLQSMPPPPMTPQSMTPQPMIPQYIAPHSMPPQSMPPSPMPPQSTPPQWAGNHSRNPTAPQWSGGQSQTAVVTSNGMPNAQMNGRFPQGQVANFAPGPLQPTSFPGNMVMHPIYSPSQVSPPIGSGQINNAGYAMATPQVFPGTEMVNRGVTRTMSQRDDAVDDYQQGATKRHAGSEVRFITPMPPTSKGYVTPVRNL